MSDSSDRFACPGCGKRFRWNAEIAGRKVRCTRCNLKMRIPAAAGATAEALETPAPPAEPSQPDAGSDAAYDLSLDNDLAGLAPTAPVSPVAANGDRCPSCNSSVKPGAVICINCGFNLQAGTKMQTRVETDADADDADSRPAASTPSASGAAAALATPRSGVVAALENRADDTAASTMVNLWLPLGLIIVGLGMTFAEHMYFSDSALQGATQAILGVGIELAIQIPLLLFAVTLAAKALGVSFGPMGQAVFKLVAVILGPSAIGGIVTLLVGGIAGSFAGGMASFIFYWILLSVLFDLEGLDTLYVIIIIWAVQFLAGFLMVVILLSIFA